MHIWWGWRLGFDCSLLYAVFYYFSLGKSFACPTLLHFYSLYTTCSQLALNWCNTVERCGTLRWFTL